MIAYTALPSKFDGDRRKKPRIDPASNPITNPFTVLVDTREQAPWDFSGLEGGGPQAGRPLIVETRVETLASGDYSIAGCEARMAIERKSVADWFGSIGKGRERFEREMERLSKLDFAAVVIEGGWHEIVLEPPSNTKVTGKMSSKTIASWCQRYGVHFFPMTSRRHAELFTFSLLEMYWRQRENRIKAAIDAAAAAMATQG